MADISVDEIVCVNNSLVVDDEPAFLKPISNMKFYIKKERILMLTQQ